MSPDRKITDEKSLRGRKGAERDRVCICGVVREEESVCPSDAQRKEETARGEAAWAPFHVRECVFEMMTEQTTSSVMHGLENPPWT